MTNLVINPVAFHLGNLSVKWYGIIMAVAIVLACWMAINEGKKRQIIPDDFVDLLLWAVPLGYVGARIYYVIFEWGYYSQHPEQIIAIWNGGIAIYGGLIAGLIVLLIFCSYCFPPNSLFFCRLFRFTHMLQKIPALWFSFLLFSSIYRSYPSSHKKNIVTITPAAPDATARSTFWYGRFPSSLAFSISLKLFPSVNAMISR